MGAIRAEWVFPEAQAPELDAVVEALSKEMGLQVKATHDDNGALIRTDIPVINEVLFAWERQENRIRLFSPLPGHPYVWARLNAVMEDSGGRIIDGLSPWRPELNKRALDRPWSELTKRQRFLLRLPAIAAWRPFDFLAVRE